MSMDETRGYQNFIFLVRGWLREPQDGNNGLRGLAE